MEQVETHRPLRPRLINLKSRHAGSHDSSLKIIQTSERLQGAKMIIPNSTTLGPIVEAEIYDGIDRDQFSTVYQPLHHLSTSQGIFGYEMLCRWSRAGRGVLLPDQFLHVAASARDKGLISALNSHVSKIALKEYASSRRTGRISKRAELSLNISCKALNENFVQDIVDAISFLDLDPSRICIEVRADELDYHDGRSNALRAFREAGCSVLIDGFGLRSAGLAFLVDGTANRLKLARSLVAGIVSSSREKIALDHLTSLARDLNVQVIANGIENQLQLNVIQDAGLESGQGWHLSRPIDTFPV